MTEEFSISTPETKFHRKFKIWQELVNQTAQAVGNKHGRQAVGCLYFGSCEKISGHSKRSVPTERTASYISEKFALKSWRSCRTSHRIRKKSLIFQSFVVAKELLNSANACVLVICPLTSIIQDQIAEAKALLITCVSLHDLGPVYMERGCPG